MRVRTCRSGLLMSVAYVGHSLRVHTSHHQIFVGKWLSAHRRAMAVVHRRTCAWHGTLCASWKQ